MLEHNMVNCEGILKGEESLALPNYSEDQRKKLEYQYLEIISIIEQSLPTTLIKSR